MRIFSLPVVLLFCIFFLSSYTFADTTYKVKKGDSLYKISKKFKVSVNEIKNANNLVSSRIKPGRGIMIPLTDRKQKPLLPVSDIHREVSKPKAEDKVTSIKFQEEESYQYTVKKGDSLSVISKKFSISVAELKEINSLKSTRLKTGQQLLVKRIVPKTYTVQKGDTLFKIARKFAVDADELREINGLETDHLKPGRNLFLKQETEPDEQKQYAAILSQKDIDKIDKDVPDVSIPEDVGLKDKLILFAKKFMNIPYRFGGTSIFGIDCSGYVQKVYSMIGVNLPRSAREQFHEGQPVDTGELSIGDLVFFRTYAPFPSHVGIYLGDNLFIHASSRGKKVTIDSLAEPFYVKRFIGAKRVLREDTLEGG
jgi:peptidoglycan endopeptidase LytE